jgi:hypothetical protein
MNHRPWSSGGDGPLFGVHCDIQTDPYFNSHNDDNDGDDMWQSQQTPSNQKPHGNDEIMNNALPPRQQYQPQQPHLRAICRYGNDVNDMWRCIALLLQISSVLSSSNVSSSCQSSQDQNHLTCAIECWDSTDGHILLIEAAEYLPSWVDDDALQGGVGGPAGCRNRCWIVNGEVHLIPPSLTSSTESKVLSRDSAISILMQSIKFKDRGDSKSTVASATVQHAIQNRINRTDYSMDPVINRTVLSNSNPHWHVTAAALPASVARFIQTNPSLIPIIVDSFCTNAPKYQRKPNGSLLTSMNNGDETHTKTMNPLGNSFPYEQIVIISLVLTRTNYAELVTGRGIVPSFPIPSAYRSVELNRFQRQLRLSTHEDGRFPRTVDVGIRLCAGLDWILSSTRDEEAVESAKDSALDLEDIAIKSLGVVERRLRIYWTRIDAEANGRSEQSDDDLASLPWIEQAWVAGPNGNGVEHAQVDSSLLQALDAMSRCHVFNPELCHSLWKSPCPSTRPGVSLLQIVKLGMKHSSKLLREEFTEDMFPMPNAVDIDDYGWMEVDSLEELEEEMNALSSCKATVDSSSKAKSSRPRRKTRRSRVDKTFNCCNEDVKSFQEKDDAETLNKILTGFRTFVDGDGDLDGVLTPSLKNPTCASVSGHGNKTLVLDSQNVDNEELNIDPRKFLNILHAMLKNNRDIPQAKLNSFKNDDDDISKFFFHEDLDDGIGSEESDDDSQLECGPGQDEFMMQNIMVSITVNVLEVADLTLISYISVHFFIQ